MVIKITAIEVRRGRKYSENYNSAHYDVMVRVEATTAKDTLDDMRKVAIEGLMKLEAEELIKVGDVIGVMGIEKEMLKEKKTAEVKVYVEESKEDQKKLGFDDVAEVIEKNIPKLPKTTKKIVANGKYKVAKKPCNKCGGYLSWDGWTQGSLPIHVDVEGIIIENGDCPSYDGGKG